MSKTAQVTIQQVVDALNLVAEHIEDAVIIGDDDGVRDAINLMVNATVHYLENPDDTDLVSAIVSSYDTSPRRVLGWIGPLVNENDERLAETDEDDEDED